MKKLTTKWFKKLGNDLLSLDVQQMEQAISQKVLAELEKSEESA